MEMEMEMEIEMKMEMVRGWKACVESIILMRYQDLSLPEYDGAVKLFRKLFFNEFHFTLFRAEFNNILERWILKRILDKVSYADFLKIQREMLNHLPMLSFSQSDLHFEKEWAKCKQFIEFHYGECKIDTIKAMMEKRYFTDHTAVMVAKAKVNLRPSDLDPIPLFPPMLMPLDLVNTLHLPRLVHLSQIPGRLTIPSFLPPLPHLPITSLDNSK